MAPSASTPTPGHRLLSLQHLSADTHAVTMTVTDSAGATCATPLHRRHPAALTVTAPEDGAVLFDPVLFEATVADNEDAPDDVDLSWRATETGCSPAMGLTPRYGLGGRRGFERGRPHHLGHGHRHPRAVRHRDPDPHPQPAARCGWRHISPDPAHNDDTLTRTATATDADGDTPALSYAWSDGAAGPTLALSGGLPGDTFVRRPPPTRPGPQARTPPASPSATATRRAWPSSRPPSRLDTLTCAVTDIVDPDGDTLSVDFA